MSTDIKLNIQEALQSFNGGSLFSNAIGLFNILGYNTARQQQLSPADFKTFNTLFVKNSRNNFNEAKALINNWKQVQLLFQLTQTEMSHQSSMFDTGRVDNTIIEAYLFFAIELTDAEYTRTQLSDITREVNKVFSMPVMVLFKYGQHLTLSVIKRRLHKRDESKDVLEKVTLIKDIDIKTPHRAHIEILYDLSFQKLYTDFEFHNFVELHKAWQKTLDTDALNKRFYKELANWYFWSLDKVQFPDDTEKDKDIRNATNLIRLITRVVFIWFIKEKRLVPDSIFNEKQISKIIKDFNKTSNSANYYQAILQNLFFGTLNQEMGKREFAIEGETIKENKDQYGVKNIYRYADKLLIDKERVITLFEKVPFLNGGLFDCLDKLDDNNKVVYVDGFSREPKKQAIVPDYLFFNKEQDVDLNDIYGTKKKKYKVKGLIELLNSYKFTITENTPLEEEIALDPELLGKVFENLLASYNPETKTTARKLTGSFYTPRDIVDYMVSESLKEYLKQTMGDKISDLESRLDDLFLYNENPNPFTKEETNELIQAIDTCKILDPACGSGAFPMGMLHKLVHLLQKLDPANTYWRELQKSKAIRDTEMVYKRNDKLERERLLVEINDVFDNNTSDYGRKLYLIENCIYGIDIQPVAVQIAKLRFFISLVVDQTKDDTKPNFGIRSLPNLETKLVAANTLIGLEKPKQQALRNLTIEDEIDKKEAELKEVRHKYFMAKKRDDKTAYQKKDKTLRVEIANLLKGDGWDTTVAEKIVEFDPYNQNMSASWFEAEWMFGKDVEKGFNIVIGNPPYGIVYDSILKKKYENYYPTFKRNTDIYVAFFHFSVLKLKNQGVLSFITPNTYLNGDYFKVLRKFFKENSKILEIVDFKNSKIFHDPTVYVSITTISHNKNIKIPYDCLLKISNEDSTQFDVKTFSITEKDDSPIKPRVQIIDNIFRNLGKGLFNLEEKFSVKDVGFNYWSIGKGKKRDGDSIGDRVLYSGEQQDERDVPYIKGRDISKYSYNSLSNYLKYNYQDCLDKDTDIFRFSRELLEISPKIIYRQTSNKIIAAIDYNKCLVDKTVHIIIPKMKNESLLFLLSLLNSNLFNFFYKDLSQEVEGRTFAQVKTTYIKKLPIIIPENFEVTKKFEYITSIIITNNNSSFFERLIDAMVYELYLPDEMKAANCEILKHLDNLPELNDDWSNEQKLKTVEQVYKQLSDPHHPISSALLRMMNIEEIEIIEGRK